MNQIQPMDWSATAAWIALAISITGTILSPIINTFLSNRHQLKLRKLDTKEKQQNKLIQDRTLAIENFLSYVGSCITYPTKESIAECNHHFFQIYVYVPKELWKDLDRLFISISETKWGEARTIFHSLIRPITEILKEPLQ